MSSFLNSQSGFSLNRRSFLRYSAGGLSYLALAHLLGLEKRGMSAAAPTAFHPLAPKAPHHTPKAKAVICLFQHGGPSQMEKTDDGFCLGGMMRGFRRQRMEAGR